jgi:hypothetical protein
MISLWSRNRRRKKRRKILKNSLRCQKTLCQVRIANCSKLLKSESEKAEPKMPDYKVNLSPSLTASDSSCTYVLNHSLRFHLIDQLKVDEA